MRSIRSIVFGLVALAWLFCGACSTRAEYYINRWIGSSGNWSNPANWDTGLVPNNGTPVPGDKHNAIWLDGVGTITNDIPVLIQVLFIRGSGITIQLNTDMELDLELLWAGGTVTGPAQMYMERLVIEPSPVGISVLDAVLLFATNYASLGAPVEMRHYPAEGRFARILLDTGSDARLRSEGSLTALPTSTDRDLETFGDIYVVTDFEPFLCAAGVLSHGRLFVEGQLVLSNANMRHDGSAVTFEGGQILNRSTLPDQGQIFIAAGSVLGDGHIDKARIGTPPGTESVLQGRFTFGDLVISNRVTMRVEIGGSEHYEFDHISVSDRLTYHPRLEVHFKDGFQNDVLNSDVFEIVTCDTGAVVEGGFENFAIGDRVKVDNYGSFLLDQASPGSSSMVLRDWQPIAFELLFNPSPFFYHLSGVESLIEINATVTAIVPVNWAGATLRGVITAEYTPGEDHLGIRSITSVPGQINTERDPMDPEALIIRFGAVPVATASGILPDRDFTAGDTLVCTFNANATTAAVQALLRAITYKSDVYSYTLFENDISAVHPNRTCELTITDSLGYFVTGSRDVEFPYVVGLRCTPPSIFVSSVIPAQMIASADFNNGDFSQRLGTQVTYTSCDPSILSVSPLPSGVQEARFIGTTPEERACKIIAQVDSFRAECCVDLVGHGGFLFSCILRALGFSDNCQPSSSPFGRESLSASPILSLANFYALESLMKQSPEGRRLVDLYWRHTTEVTDIAFAHPQLIPEARNLVLAWQPAVSAFLAGHGTNAAITQTMINALNSTWNKWTNYASPALRTNLVTEHARFNGFQDFVNKDFNQWAQMLQIPVPTNAWIHLSSAARQTNGHFAAQANYISGLNYSFSRSHNLSNWSAVTSLKLITNGLTLGLTDTNPPATNSFYRAVVLP
jgi:hypothetical protein